MESSPLDADARRRSGAVMMTIAETRTTSPMPARRRKGARGPRRGSYAPAPFMVRRTSLVGVVGFRLFGSNCNVSDG